MIKTIKEVQDLKSKKIILRAGVNVPLNENGEIDSDFRLEKIFPTIEYLL